MTKKIVKRTDANNETLYFYTHSDAVDVGEGSSTKSLTEVIDDTLHKSAQTLTNAEKTQVYANLGLNGVDDVPTDNSNNVVRSGGVKAAIDDVIDDFTNRGFMYKGIAPASAPLGEDKTFYIAKSGDYSAYTGIGDGSFTLNGIAVLTYATTTASGAWTKNDIVLFDEEPTAGSGNLVKSGGVKDFIFKELYNQQIYSQSDFEMTNYSAGYQSLGGTLKAGVEYKIAIRLTGFDTIIPTAYSLYRAQASFAYHIPITDLVLNSLTNEREAVITIIPEEDVSYIFMRMKNSGIIPPEGNHVYVETYAFDDKFLRVDGQSLTPAQQANVKNNIGLVIKDTFDEESNSLSTDMAISDYVKGVVSETAGILNTETAILSRDNVNLQETLSLEKPSSVKFFRDNYSFYEDCVDELYIIPNVPNIVFKYYSSRLFVRALDGSNNVYKWHSAIYVNTIENGKIVELKVTLAGTDEDYPLDTTIGYVIFKDIESFINNPVAPYTATLVDGVANEIIYSPKIAMSLGYYNSTPIITGDTIYIPYKLKNPTIEELEQKIDDIKPSQSLNILFIGNSYTANSVSYVPFILKNACPNLKFRIGVLFLDGGKLSQHLANILNEDVVNEDGETSSPVNYNNYSYITDEMDSWVRNSANITIFSGLDDTKWDIVSTHNANRYVVGEWSECYAPFIYRLHKAIAEYLKYPIKFGWDLTHGSNMSSVEADVTKFMSSVDKAEKAEKLTCTEIVFPYGTAVQNLRTVSAMQQLGDGSHGNLLVDNSHLQSGIGQLAASYAVAIKLLEQVGCTSKIIAEPTFPTTEWVQAINTIRGSDIGTGSIGVTEHNCFLAQVAAIQAVKKPYEVTDINEYDINGD